MLLKHPLFVDNFNMEPISIIGNGDSSKKNRSSPNLARPQTGESDVYSSGDELPPPGKRKVIVAQRPNNFMWTIKVRKSIMIGLCIKFYK